MLITFIRLVANLSMAKLIQSIRVRWLFFFSLYTTSLCLNVLGIFLDEGLNIQISESASFWIRVILLALHVFLVQFGLQTLAGNLTDLLYPTKFKSVMKGLTRAIFSVTLIIFTSSLTIKVDCDIKYSWTFWIIGTFLLLAFPFLYVFIPEMS